MAIRRSTHIDGGAVGWFYCQTRVMCCGMKFETENQIQREFRVDIEIEREEGKMADDLMSGRGS